MKTARVLVLPFLLLLSQCCYAAEVPKEAQEHTFVRIDLAATETALVKFFALKPDDQTGQLYVDVYTVDTITTIEGPAKTTAFTGEPGTYTVDVFGNNTAESFTCRIIAKKPQPAPTPTPPKPDDNVTPKPTPTRWLKKLLRLLKKPPLKPPPTVRKLLLTQLLRLKKLRPSNRTSPYGLQDQGRGQRWPRPFSLPACHTEQPGRGLNSPYLRHNPLVPGQMWHYLGSGTGDKASFGRGDR